MPEINGTLIRQELTTVVEDNNQSLNVNIETETQIVSGVLTSNEGEIAATITNNEEELSGSLVVVGKTYEGTMDIHYGVDGKPGKDGISPTIIVDKDTEKEYILKITDKNGSFLTPNLKPTIDEKENWDKKVDEDLLEYPLLNATQLSEVQRSASFLYVRQHHSGQNNKIPLSVVALKPEVEDRLRTKLQTVKKQPNDWKVGDYIFLEKGEVDN